MSEDSLAANNSPERAASNAAITSKASGPPRGGTSFPIVGIGSSAGGLEAFEKLLATLRPDSGMAFVLVQHLDPQHESALAEILGSFTEMPVVTVQDGLAIESNHVYVIPPNTSMVIENGHLRLAKREAGLHLPIDIFFRSLADAQGPLAIGVVLSGNASDGSDGLVAIRAEGGLTFAQDEASARFEGMPRNAIATGAVDYVLTPGAIGAELAHLGHHPYLLPTQNWNAETETLPHADAELMRILFALLKTATGVDFAAYKQSTVRRRISRRMLLLRIENNLAAYVRHAERNPNEVRELYRDLLINVTSFFRDPEAFESICNLLSNVLAADAQREAPIRIWVPGCATGEEIYSLAICVKEFLDDRQLSIPAQLFGTDLSDMALARARQGSYSAIITETVSPARLQRFFLKTDCGYQIAKSLRENCVFARHDVTQDPPFSRLDLVSCRNVLIYLDVPSQRRILPIFHYALKPQGLLLLGSAETTWATSDLFTPIDKAHNIFGRTPGVSHFVADAWALTPVRAGDRVARRAPGASLTDLQKRLDRLIQSKYSPDAVLLDANLHILQFRGHTSAYLDPTPGDASLHLLRMARESLVVPLRRLMKAAVEIGHSVSERNVLMERDGQQEAVDLEATPLGPDATGEQYWLLAFVRVRRPTTDRSQPFLPTNGNMADESRSAELERELSETREYLCNLTEDHEAHAEELQAANEEARSANEELQSTNEELGTTKEELQSANEELVTINEELQSRNKELLATNNDLKNVFDAVSVAILMVDGDLRVRRFNNGAESLLDLNVMDVGRPVGHFRGKIQTPDLEKQVRRVMDTLHTSEEEIRDDSGHWYSVVARPYRTLDDRIAGAVITIQDINPLKRGLEAAEEARDYAEGMIETVREPLIVLDQDLRVRRATSAFYETFLVSREETEGRFLQDLGNGQWNRPRLRELIGSALFRNESFTDYEVQHDFPHIGRRTMRLNARKIPRRQAENRTLLLAIEDVTERREVAEIRFQRLFETAKDGIVIVEGETEIILDVNPYLLECTGFPREALVGRRLAEAAPFIDWPHSDGFVLSLKNKESIRQDDLSLRTATGGVLDMEVVANLYRVGTKPVAQLNLRDIRVRKEQQDRLRRSVEEKGVLLREIHHRVKNNLQVIVSLLGLQATYTQDAKALAAFEDMEGRVRAIAHIHETLYSTADLARIEFAAYLTKLAQELLQLHGTTADGVTLAINVQQVMLGIEQAIPLGLIANELLLNSLKHGLQDGRGEIGIRLRRVEDPGGDQPESQWVELSVSDDGPGLQPLADPAKASSMSFRLIYLLSKQLRGRVEFSQGPGTSIILYFPWDSRHLDSQ